MDYGKKKMMPKTDKKRKPMMYGRTPMKKGKMPRYGMFDGGYASAMSPAKPN
jgi:hypothetical protein